MTIHEKFLKQEKEERMKAAEQICNLNAPTADWEQIEREIERGYG